MAIPNEASRGAMASGRPLSDEQLHELAEEATDEHFGEDDSSMLAPMQRHFDERQPSFEVGQDLGNMILEASDLSMQSIVGTRQTF